MPFISDWESIKEARDRIIAKGLSREQAERDLCGAIEACKIGVRQILAEPPGSGLGKRPLDSPEIVVPVDLSPSDIDWEHSKPKDPSNIWIDRSQRPFESGLMYYDRMVRRFQDWTVDRIDVRTEGVTRIFCDIKEPTDIMAPASKTKNLGGRGSKRRAVEDEIAKRWPDGIPDTLSTKEAAAQILENIETKVTDRHVQRILKDHQRVPAK